MSRFSDYLSSMITPQMTLLEKFNKLLEFLKENNYISVFYSSENYNPTTRNYQIGNVNTLNYDLKLGDCVIFSNGYYAFVETLGENTFTIGNVLYFQGEQGVSVVSATINNTGNLILTLSNNSTIDAGNTGAVRDFIIDNNQHLIVRYLNGTQNDLGAIFNGDINISGTLNATKVTGDEIIETMSGYYAELPSTTGWTFEKVYIGAVKNGNKLTVVVAVNATKGVGAISNPILARINIPASVGNKLYPATVGQYQFLDNRVINAWSSYGNNIDVICYIDKTSNTRITFVADNTTNFVQDTKYYLRYEATFLLGESL